jgi:hypothetical protein
MKHVCGLAISILLLSSSAFGLQRDVEKEMDEYVSMVTSEARNTVFAKMKALGEEISELNLEFACVPRSDRIGRKCRVSKLSMVGKNADYVGVFRTCNVDGSVKCSDEWGFSVSLLRNQNYDRFGNELSCSYRYDTDLLVGENIFDQSLFNLFLIIKNRRTEYPVVQSLLKPAVPKVPYGPFDEPAKCEF